MCVTTTQEAIPPEQAGALVHRVGMLIIGELHGTQEFPRLVADVAAAALPQGKVVVALELSADAQLVVDNYIESNGTTDDRTALLSHGVWQSEDGRTSAAVVELVEACRRMAQQDASLTVALIDARRDEWATADRDFAIRRDQLMADRLMAAGAHGAVVALLGNIHARLDNDFVLPMPTGYEPVAALVKQRREVVSLLGVHAGGTAWCLMDRGQGPSAGAHPVRGQDRGPERFLSVTDPCQGYSGVAYVGPVNDSPPAIGGNTSRR